MPPKRKLVVKTLAEKCQVLKELKKRVPNKEVSKKYGVPKNTISTWLANKEKLFSALEKTSSKKKNSEMATFQK